MFRKRLLAPLGVLAIVGGLAFIIPMTSASASTCSAPAWSSTATYTGGAQVSYNDHQYTAKWWTLGDQPDMNTGDGKPWADNGSCSGGGSGGGGNPTPTPTSGGGSSGGGSGSCNYPAWAEGTTYKVGDRVTYQGQAYEAIQAHTAVPGAGWNPAATPTLWKPVSDCGSGGGGGGNPTPTPTSGGGGGGGSSGFVVSSAQFDQMFPNRNSFYTYQGLVNAMSAYPAFATTGGPTVEGQEAAAFLANVAHETGGLVYITEVDKSGNYCDTSRSYGCPAGTYAYYGRGPIQLSWNFNYYAAGQALGLDLLNNPYLVENDAAVSWKTGLWYWMTQNGPGTMTAHNAMVNGAGFGETIRSINGSIECNGGNPAEVQDRVSYYQKFTQILGVPTGNNLSC